MELKHVSALTPSTLQIHTGGEKSEQNLTHRDGKENKSQVPLGKKREVLPFTFPPGERSRRTSTLEEMCFTPAPCSILTHENRSDTSETTVRGLNEV